MSAVDTSNLPCAVVGPCSEGAPWASLRLDGRASRLRIEVPRAYAREGVLGFALLLGYRLSFARLEALADVQRAFVLSVEQPDAGHGRLQTLGAVGVVRLGDGKAPRSPNCSGAPAAESPLGAFVGDQLGLWIEAGVRRSNPGTRVYLRVCLHELVSNTVSIGLDALDVLEH